MLKSPGRARARPATWSQTKEQRHNPLLFCASGDWQQATDTASGNMYYWNAVTGESVWTIPRLEDVKTDAAPVAAVPGGLPIQFTGQGTATKVMYRQILAESLSAVAAARAAGKRRLQIEFPLDDSDEGKTLVKRYELMATWAEELAAGIKLPRIVRVGEDIQIRDNITPGGGGEYLTNEGVYGYRLSSADNSEQVLPALVAGDTLLEE